MQKRNLIEFLLLIFHHEQLARNQNGEHVERTNVGRPSQSYRNHERAQEIFIFSCSLDFLLMFLFSSIIFNYLKNRLIKIYRENIFHETSASSCVVISSSQRIVVQMSERDRNNNKYHMTPVGG